MPSTKTLTGSQSNGPNLAAVELIDVTMPDKATNRTRAVIGCLTETVSVSQFTDGGSTAGTYQMAGSLPAGAIILRTKYGPIVGFAGDSSAVLIVGDGVTTNRFNTGTPSVFATAAVGVDAGAVSGLALMLTEIRPTLTITSGTDFTLVASNAAGVVTVNIYYIHTS